MLKLNVLVIGTPGYFNQCCGSAAYPAKRFIITVKPPNRKSKIKLLISFLINVLMIAISAMQPKLSGASGDGNMRRVLGFPN